MSVDLAQWVGRTETITDLAAAAPLERLAALLDHDDTSWPRNEVPPVGHWLYFLPQARQSQIDRDGHPKRGGFLPPVILPRRMWAGGRLTYHAPIPIGSTIERRSTIADIKSKTGASGEMVFVVVRHEIMTGGTVCVVEEQDLVYRGESSAPAKLGEPAASGEINKPMTADPVMLFRYSALTFNAHRIHYDREYAQKVEGYPALVVHGPYIATMLMDHFCRETPNARLKKFTFRAQRPLFDGAPFELCLKRTPTGADLWTLDKDKQITMSAGVEAA
jgi:3-methylfumaryl-CoA hydratase